MNNAPGQVPEYLGAKSLKENALLHYVQAMEPETVSQLSRPASAEVMQVIEHNVLGLLGGLPPQDFDVTVTTSRENLGRLLASAIMSGYFLKGAEQRLAFEQSIGQTGSLDDIE
ncbi:DUF760 domain-containing protein [Romeria aff. gracilis LEGE 07310]|uniref:DUF760 domain-containing protein n=1 Tax=Vasconcelosia minhoensis LEGE 07310 TaxID=915328 RepID=A0A8J7DMF5_9CYAN|nr:DUF760 domain-containing protein [Romeria aff. gracilis LEGE 07310]